MLLSTQYCYWAPFSAHYLLPVFIVKLLHHFCYHVRVHKRDLEIIDVPDDGALLSVDNFICRAEVIGVDCKLPFLQL